MGASASYGRQRCCFADCVHLNRKDDEPCWGEIFVTDEVYNDEDSWWIHECEGHYGCYSGEEKYKLEPATSLDLV